MLPSLPNNQGPNGNIASIHDIVGSIKGDIARIKTNLTNLPPFPKGKLYFHLLTLIFYFSGQPPPVPLATFQNNVNKIEKNMIGSIGINNEKVFPKIADRARTYASQIQNDDEISVSDELKLLSKPVK